LSHYYGTEVADGFFHSFSGWVVYIVAFLMLFAVGWIVDRFRPSNYREGRKTESIADSASHKAVAAAPVVQTEGMD
jgi:hypothetical protein